MHAVSRQPSDRAPARMSPLAVLPVFIDLQGARAIVAGGTDAAAWKAELLMAAGAEVHVYAPAADLGDAFGTLLAGEARPGRLVHHDSGWDAAAFVGAAFAVADVGSEAAAAFAEAARAAGVPCNLVDRPEFSRIQFGAIVNRSPVVVGISTSGAAPVLGQAIRRRIETLLPQTLAAWAALAARLRTVVGERIASGPPRRRFWDAFAERAFGPAPTGDDERQLERDVDRVAAVRDGGIGRVTLVGAGPGDAELLTLRAVRALQAADVILFDDLVSSEVLELARREAKRMVVGKRGGRPSCRQEDINDLMVKLAKAGKRVVRLKSGDPMVFGRAGEEIARLEREGIPVDVVPGITAALAMASAFGVSLTHRDAAQSVRFVTGHSHRGDIPRDIDWRAMADPCTTTMFYMSGRTADRIADRLMAEGLSGTTPVAVAAALSRQEQRLASGTLDMLAILVRSMGSDLPVLVGVGRVFAQRARHMSWEGGEPFAPGASGRAAVAS